MTPHLTHEQLCDFILDPPPQCALSTAHLAACPACKAELATLSASLRHFQEASRSFAERELARRPAVIELPRRRSLMAVPAYLAAAALFLGAVFIPLRLHRPGASAPPPSPVAAVPASVQTTESDEAFLNEINQDIAASVPSPMEPLADPTSDAAGTTSNQGNSQ